MPDAPAVPSISVESCVRKGLYWHGPSPGSMPDEIFELVPARHLERHCLQRVEANGLVGCVSLHCHH